MSRNFIQFIFLFVILTLLQVVCNKIILFNVACPIIFIYTILRLPVDLNKSLALTLAFITGLVVDVFGNTPGMNALCCTVVCGIRIPVFNFLDTHDDDESTSILPSIHTLGIANYIKYIFILVPVYCSLLFFIQAFTLRNPLLTLSRIGASSLLSIIIILGIESLVGTQREKRL